MRCRILCLVLLALAAGVADAALTFPYCKCADYAASSAPWSVELVPGGTDLTATSFTAAFTVAPIVPPPDEPSACYNVLVTEGVHKIAFDTSAVCKDLVRVWINGVLSTSSKYEPKTPTHGYVRVMFNPPLAAGESAEVKITGFEACSSPAILFNTDTEPFTYRYSLFNATVRNTLPCCATSFGPGGGGVSPPPPEDSTIVSPPPEESTSPPEDSLPPESSLPSEGSLPPEDSTTPPPEGSTPPPEGSTPPPEGSTPPPEGSTPAEESSSLPGQQVPPSPPSDGPSPPVGPFPWCRCNTNNFDTPWFIENIDTLSTDTTNEYTFSFGENGCLGSSPCCDMDLWKIEFHIGEQCTSSVASVDLNINHGSTGIETISKFWLFHHYGPGRMVFKVTKLELDSSTAFGSSVKIALLKDSLCPDIFTFLAENSYALFNKKQTCCPTWPMRMGP